jgi:hypothetical protein
MTRKLLAVSLVVLATVAATAFAGTSSTQVSASKQCAAVQAQLGPFWFERAFASFGACVSALAPLARQDANTAAASCRNERAYASFAATHGGKTFARFYGVGRKSKNAYGRCVSAKERSASVVVAAAASACQAEQADAGFASSHDGKTFAQFYGTNAFAACVALKARASFTVSPLQPSPTPTPQQESKGGTVISGCGPVPTGGPPRPLIASCMVVQSN